MSPALATKFFTTSATWEAHVCVCVCVCVCVSHLIYSLIHWWTPKLFPYHSAIMNNATMNMWVQIISSIFCSHFLCIYTQKWNCSSKVVLFLIFLRKSVLFTIVVAPICIPATGAQGFSFLWILSNTSYLWSFWYSHSDRCEMIYHHGLHLHFPDDQWVGGSFYVSFGHLCIFGKCLLSPSAHFFFFAMELSEIFMYLEY